MHPAQWQAGLPGGARHGTPGPDRGGIVIASTATPRVTADLLGQPRGLAYLGGTVFWEAASLYGMQALVVLYMVEALLLPGHVEAVRGMAATRAAIEAVTGRLSDQAFAAQLFGLFAGLVRFTPVFGGLIGDRWLGRRLTITLGCLLMTLGHFALAFDASFLLALLLLILGAGCLGSNLQSQAGALYPPGDRRRDDGFQLYYLGLNLGAFAGPVGAGLLGQIYGWHFGFGFAGLGMLIGLAIYLAGQRHMPPDPPRGRGHAGIALDAGERRIVAVLVAMTLLTASFWVAQSQVWNVYNFWVRDRVELSILGWQVPVPWFQAIDALAPAALLPPIVLLWRAQAERGREPGDLAKMAIGCLLFGLGMVWLAAADRLAGPGGRVPLLWALAFHLLSNAGWLYFVPIAVALYARAAPASVNAMMIGVNSFAVFIGSTVSGRLGAYYETMSHSAFWLLHAAIVASGALLLAVLGGPLRRALSRPDPASLRGAPLP